MDVFVNKMDQITVNQKQKTIHALVVIIGELKVDETILVTAKRLKDTLASVNIIKQNVRLVINLFNTYVKNKLIPMNINV
jgi:hypothetical protein